MPMTEEELKLVYALLQSFSELPYGEQLKMLGSIGVTMAYKLERKMHYYPYCQSHGIRFEDMTEDDYVNAYLEMN